MINDSAKLTAREKEVLKYLLEGFSNREISQRLGISYETAKCHSKRVISKLGVKNRKELKMLLG